MLESVIQTKTIKTLELAGWYVIKLIQTNKNGIMDLVALKNGRAVFIEVKTDTGKQSELQKYRQKEITEQGFEVLIITNSKQIQSL